MLPRHAMSYYGIKDEQHVNCDHAKAEPGEE